MPADRRQKTYQHTRQPPSAGQTMIEAGHDVSISGGMFTLVNGSYTQVNQDGRGSGTLLDFASFEALHTR